MKKFFMFLVILGVLVYSVYDSRKDKKDRAEYLSIEYISELNGTVRKFETDKGATFLIVGTTKVFVTNSRNNMLQPSEFCNFIKEGDILVKRSNSKYVSIERGEWSYKFKVGDFYFSNSPERRMSE